MAEVANYLTEREAIQDLQNSARNYVSNAILFGLSGAWHVSSLERHQIRFHEQARLAAGFKSSLPANYGTRLHPDQPPAGLSDKQAATARKWLEKRNWTLIRNLRGEWGLARTL
jgi:hypothetical protein